MKKILNNKKGFTLVELLAVIVIMGILMMVAIPSISRVIENSRKDTFVDIAKAYANAAKTLWTADTLTCEGTVASAVDDGDYYILINTTESARTVLPVLVDQGGKSSWGNRDVNGYVRVHVETVTDSNGEPRRTTTFYVSLSDGTHGLIDEGSMTSDNLKKGNVKMDLSSDDKKKVELTLDNGNLNCSKTNLGTYVCTEVTPVKSITGLCVDDSSYAGVNNASSINDDTPGVLAGSGSSTDPYKIESIEDLVTFSKTIKNDSKAYYRSYIVLVNDLDIKSKSSYVNYNEKSSEDINGDGVIDTIYDELNKNAGLPCINDNQKLAFSFDGNNKSIKNLYVNIKNLDANKTIYVSLFGGFDGTFNSSGVKNLRLENINYTVDTAGTAYVSPLFSTFYWYNDNQIKNIAVSGKIDVKCGKDCNVGGAIGIVQTYSSINTGGRNIVDSIISTVNIKVEGASATVGGISAAASNYGSLVKNSLYSGNISVNATGEAKVGGINGRALYFTNVNNVVNSNINVTANKAYIYGLSEATTTNNSVFNGKIVANTYQVANIGGLTSGKVKNSYANATIINNSKFRSEYPVIAGISTKGDVNNSYFIGNIEYNNEKVWGGGGPTSLISLISGKCSNINNSFARGTLKNTQSSTYETFFGYLKTNDPDNNECSLNNSYYTSDTTYSGNAKLDTSGQVVSLSDIKTNNWFENVLNLKTAWKHKNGNYPILYLCNSYDYSTDTCTYGAQLLPNQKEIAIK